MGLLLTFLKGLSTQPVFTFALCIDARVKPKKQKDI